MRTSFRVALGLIVAGGAAAACGDDSCPHYVFDARWDVQATPAQTCAVYRGEATCSDLCGREVSSCRADPSFTDAYNQTSGDAGAPGVCTSRTQPVTVTCEQGHTEGTENASKCGVYQEGRRPEGLEPPDVRAAHAVGAYLANCAYLEAASVLAFEVMIRELLRFGAPVELVMGCERARTEEIRHARTVRTLAEEAGAIVPPVIVVKGDDRSVFQAALENVIEGVVNETYAAVQALYRAEHAKDPALRAIYAEIAEDECRHAQLSWAIDTWYRWQLPMRACEALDAAKHAAIARLARQLSASPDPVLVHELGLPDSAAARGMFQGLHAMWTEGRREAA